MNQNPGQMRNRLAFRTIAPIIATALLSWAGLYMFVLRSVSQFADDRIQESFVQIAHDLYQVCDLSLNEILRAGTLHEDNAVRIKKATALGMVEDLMRQNRISGMVMHRGEPLLLAENTSKELSGAAAAIRKNNAVGQVALGSRNYYSYRIRFEPWEWDIIIFKDAADYAALLRSVNIAYGVTGFILSAVTLLFIYSLRRNIRVPLSNILEPISRGEIPDYKGITEFEDLSSRIRNAMELRDREARMLNNIYHLAAVKRGSDYFEEVVMTISRLFSLHAYLSKIDPDGETEHVVSLCMNGAVRKSFDISLRGTPDERVLDKKQIVIIDTGLREQFPDVHAFAEAEADFFIGFAIFNSRGEAVGILGAFGAPREITESDIKVLQTIGQIVAAEFERSDEEKEKEAIREQLFQAHKMEAIGTLAGGIAHDFNNMLQGILGHASLLKAQLRPGTSLYESADTIEHISDRAAELTRQLLGFARKGKYVIEPIAVNDVIAAVLKIISKTFDRNIAIESDLGTEDMTIEGDRSQIEQVILNLCLNARDAMSGGGRLLIRTSVQDNAPDPAAPAATPLRQVVITISDTGAGIPDTVKERIFEPFFTTKELGKGTGMGLAMVYGVVKNHNGQISVETSPGSGTTFTVAFPAVRPAVRIEPASRSDPAPGKGTILVVDDEEYIRDILRTMLEKLGYRVIQAADGKEALQIYAEQCGAIDLVILDLIMPVMSGKDTLDHIRQINGKARILIASGHTTAGEAGFPLQQGLLGFIQKPFSMHSIADKVQSMLSA
ncbi:MAG: response regulator [Nitrospirae bacterium]|nr:response regulator [Nitrospirota bacterium]